ncbi:hypothetical protein L204_106420 [Cryptococcus depauperatus]
MSSIFSPKHIAQFVIRRQKRKLKQKTQIMLFASGLDRLGLDTHRQDNRLDFAHDPCQTSHQSESSVRRKRLSSTIDMRDRHPGDDCFTPIPMALSMVWVKEVGRATGGGIVQPRGKCWDEHGTLCNVLRKPSPKKIQSHREKPIQYLDNIYQTFLS